MSNIIKIKGKTTTGAPALGDLSVRELCFVIPDGDLYIKKDAATITYLGGLNKANLASPAFTGTPTGPTAASNNNTTQLATTAFVQSLVAALGAGDMLKSVYDTNNNGRVDTADNSLLLEGHNTAYFTAYTDAAIASLVASAPGVLDTLNELATALGNDPNFATTMTTALATKLDANSVIDGGTF